MKTKLNGAVAFSVLFIILGGVTLAYGQDAPPRVGYEDEFALAADFAVKEGGKMENADVTLVEIEKANLSVSPENLNYRLWLKLKVRKDNKKAVTRYAAAVVDRDKNTMDYSLTCWILSKRSLKP